MHEYSNVEVISLTEKQFKDRKEITNVVSIKKDSEKTYSIIVKSGEKFYFRKL
jgi:hypothetical protein